MWFTRSDRRLRAFVVGGASLKARRLSAMPMRGPLPVRVLHPNEFGQVSKIGETIEELLASGDFIVVAGFAATGLILSLGLMMLFPVFDEVMGLFAQFP
jgi:hypothetical protein